MLRLIRSHWRGGTPFWRAVLGVSIALSVMVLFASTAIMGSDAFHESPPNRRMVIGIAVTLGIAAFGIWQLVGTWRAASKERSPDRGFIMRWLGRLIAMPMAIAGIALLAMLPGSISSLSDVANDRDPIARQGHRVTIAGDRLEVSGAIGWGMFEKVDRAIAASPGLRSVSLESLGGHSAAGRAIAERVRSRELNTIVVGTCASACTFIFYSGKRRYIGRKARIGFHADGSDNQSTAQAATNRSSEYWRKLGLPADFIQRVRSTPPHTAWWPTHEELRRLGFVTDFLR